MKEFVLPKLLKNIVAMYTLIYILILIESSYLGCTNN